MKAVATEHQKDHHFKILRNRNGCPLKVYIAKGKPPCGFTITSPTSQAIRSKVP